MSYKNIPVKPETKHKIDTIKSATGKNYDEIIGKIYAEQINQKA